MRTGVGWMDGITWGEEGYKTERVVQREWSSPWWWGYEILRFFFFFFPTQNAVKTHAKFKAVGRRGSGLRLWFKTCPTLPSAGEAPPPALLAATVRSSDTEKAREDAPETSPLADLPHHTHTHKHIDTHAGICLKHRWPKLQKSEEVMNSCSHMIIYALASLWVSFSPFSISIFSSPFSLLTVFIFSSFCSWGERKRNHRFATGCRFHVFSLKSVSPSG